MSERVAFPTMPDLPDGQYRTIMADPPWAYDDNLPGPGRGSNSHYDVLDANTVAGMGPQVRKVTDGWAHLYLWFTNSFVEEAYQVAREWGFEPKTVLTWVKVQDAPDTLPHQRDDAAAVTERIGMGHYFRNTTEHILFGVKNGLSTTDGLNNVPTHFFAERTDHSAKPEKAYILAEEMSQGPNLEMFSRQNRDGWTTWGDEADD